MTGTNPVSPYLSWETASTNIQDAIESALPGEVVLVTNGVYATGGKVMAGDLTNRVVIDKALLVRSVNGPEVTTIQGTWDSGTTNGPGAVRGAWLTNGAILTGFTIQGGATRQAGDAATLQRGGGIWCASSNATVLSCRITGNASYLGGGGSYGGTLRSCLVSNNCALAGSGSGGGGHSGTLVDCEVVSNWVRSSGGGVLACSLTRCQLRNNRAALGGAHTQVA